MQIRYHFVREAVEQGTITLEYCHTDEMLADSRAISMAKNPVFHKRTKHVQIRYHFIPSP